LFKIDFAAPTGSLSEFVSMFYRLETEGALPFGPERADIPHVRIHFGADCEMRFGNGDLATLNGTTLIGTRNIASEIRSDGPSVFFGFGLMPAGWATLIKASAHQYAEKVAPVDVLPAAISSALSNAIFVDDDAAGQASAAEAVLAPVFHNASNVPVWFFHAVDKWLADTLMPEFDNLVAATGLSRTATERMLRDHYGAPPNLFIRRSRALRVANRIAHGEGDWQDYVGDAFYDQSHCIREIKYFTGQTPATIRNDRATMALTQFMRRRRLAK
jgi:AraC-like DNA-binding protein